MSFLMNFKANSALNLEFQTFLTVGQERFLGKTIMKKKCLNYKTNLPSSLAKSTSISKSSNIFSGKLMGPEMKKKKRKSEKTFF